VKEIDVERLDVHSRLTLQVRRAGVDLVSKTLFTNLYCRTRQRQPKNMISYRSRNQGLLSSLTADNHNAIRIEL
jgi:hypothetical protein